MQSNTQDIEQLVLRQLDKTGNIKDSLEFSNQNRVNHQELSGIIRSLTAAGLVLFKEIKSQQQVLTDEAKLYINDGSPEFIVFKLVKDEGVTQKHIQEEAAKLGNTNISDVGFKTAMKLQWIQIDKQKGLVLKKQPQVQDEVGEIIKAINSGKQIEDSVEKRLSLKKRNLIKIEKSISYEVSKGPEFALERKQYSTVLSVDMLKKDGWKNLNFKDYNLNTAGKKPERGSEHPLEKMRKAVLDIFVDMGFQQMPTNNYVESSFWNFDALFQPQQHPSRDAHDTFFLTDPQKTTDFPQEYLQKVKQVHQHGGYGSTGYNYPWQIQDAQKNILRTHTTATSTRMLYKLAQDGFKPVRYFSVDRVFRNEAIDRTHLAEFNQIEGVLCDRGITLRHLITTLKLFFQRMGIQNLKFKPAYNPYTEPSMEIFGFSQQLNKWMEVGNSGMFRPEMLRPMGLPEDVRVAAWGLSLERPTMLLYGLDNIRLLSGYKVSIAKVKAGKICKVGI